MLVLERIASHTRLKIYSIYIHTQYLLTMCEFLWSDIIIEILNVIRKLKFDANLRKITTCVLEYGHEKDLRAFLLQDMYLRLANGVITVYGGWQS